MDNYDIPVVVYIFHRLETTKLIFEVLQKVRPRILYVYADGPREGKSEETAVKEVRDYVNSAVNWECDFVKRYSEVNLSCSPNIVRGFNEVLSKYPYGIFLEDDAVPTKEFFIYCEELLFKYEKEKKIQYIAGFNGIGDNDIIKYSYSFGRSVPMSGAIATWSDRWTEKDEKASSWLQKKKDKHFAEYFFTREFRNHSYKEFETIYNNGKGEWDIVFHYDLLSKNRFAIVPRINLVRSYGYTDGAFHPQSNIVAKNLVKYMDYSDKAFEFPMKEPEEIEWNKEYDRERQRIFISVNGNRLQRYIHYIYMKIKDFAYKYMPKKMWNAIKKVIGKR